MSETKRPSTRVHLTINKRADFVEVEGLYVKDIKRAIIAEYRAANKCDTSEIGLKCGNLVLDSDMLYSACGLSGHDIEHRITVTFGSKPFADSISFYAPAGQTTPIKVTVDLALLDGVTLDVTYPKPTMRDKQSVKWECIVAPDDTIVIDDKRYSYLIWDCVFKNEESPLTSCFFKDRRAFVFETSKVGIKLGGLLDKFGLTMRERDDMVTYWTGKLTKHWTYARVVSRKTLDAVFPLIVTASVDVHLQRLYMIFHCYDTLLYGPAITELELITEIAPITHDPTKLTVVEWGGSIINTELELIIEFAPITHDPTKLTVVEWGGTIIL